VKIGSVQLESVVLAAPMAGVTGKAFRILAKEAGCGLVCTEMVSDQALLYGNPKTLKLVDLSGEPPPVCVQIFGSQPGYMARAAKIAEELGAAVIDINMGCPTPKIVKNGEGAALMRDPKKAARIVKEVAGAVSVPVTVKMRKGWDEGSVNAVEVALRAEEAGARAITVHGRTRAQFYSGRADWRIIAEVKKAVRVPVIGNGDIWQPQDALAMMVQTGCDGVMIGRAALGNPWIFSRTVHYLKTGEILPEPSLEERVLTALRHAGLLVEIKGEKTAVLEMRKHASWYIKGVRGAAALREKIVRIKSISELRDLLLKLVEAEFGQHFLV